jgi:MOSC domain-containing protein YiiM
MTGARVVSIAFTPAGIDARPADRYARVAVEQATLVADHGIKGDRKARSGRRQLNIMHGEVVKNLGTEGYRTAPGELGEQLVIEGLPADAFSGGARIQIGDDAIIELTIIREPCDRFEHIQRKSIQDATGRIGYMARVVCGGEIAVGSSVRLVERPVQAS